MRGPRGSSSGPSRGLLLGMDVSSTPPAPKQRSDVDSGGDGEPVDRGVQDVRDRARPLAGDDQKIDLDEFAPLLLEERAHAPARPERLAPPPRGGGGAGGRRGGRRG